MPGTERGGRLAAKTTKERYGTKDFNPHEAIGRMGGKVKNPNKGFGSNRELASIAGKKGGSRSKRKKKESEDVTEN